MFRKNFNKLEILVPSPPSNSPYLSQLSLRDKTHFIIHSNLLMTHPYVALGQIYKKKIYRKII